MKSEVKPKCYFLAGFAGQMRSPLSLILFCRETKIGELTARALTLVSEMTSELSLRRVDSEGLASLASLE